MKIATTIILAMFVFGVSIILLIPNKWDHAVVIGVCGGLPILRDETGTIWLRVSSARVYRVEDMDKLACSR